MVLKDRAHGVDRCPTKLQNSIELISIGTWDSWSAISRISLQMGLVQRMCKMDIWAYMFPRCSRMLYYDLNGVGIGGPTMLNLFLLVAIAYLVFGPWMLMTFIEGLVWDTQPMRFP